jgi:DNA polymerase-3 subunit beta
MKITVNQAALKAALATCKPAVAGRSPLPVLHNVLLRTEGDSAGHRLVIQATDLEIGITRRIGAHIEEPGAVTIPAKLLSDVVGGLPGGEVVLTLNTKTQTLGIACGRFNSNIQGIEAEEFPTIPAVEDLAPTITIPPVVLRQAIDQVAFAATNNESRPVLTGVLLRLQGTTVNMVAADGFRLAVRTIQLPEAPDASSAPNEFIVPARTLSELSRIIGDAEESVAITITPDGNHVLFRVQHTELFSRLIDGQFPDFARIIPQHCLTRTVMETQELTKAVKLASFFTLHGHGVVKLTIRPDGELGPGKLVISANTAEVGDNTGDVDATVQGDGGRVALNVRYLADALNAIKTPQVVLETQTHDKPGVLRPIGQEDEYTHVIMPMTIPGEGGK